MKGRSYNQDATATATANTTADEWVNGSWTVDCICGVNFDDGEEMVNCDECGVWVHTRCSRYVKGDKSFACDKCKIRADVDDSEETEVAQLLVELPTKTIINHQRKHKMKDAIAMATNTKLRTERPRPIEDRVHVHGVPGGTDQSLFQSLPLLQLWKLSGYIPKPFRFRYLDFPCWQQDYDNVNVNDDANAYFPCWQQDYDNVNDDANANANANFPCWQQESLSIGKQFQVLNSRPPKHLPSNRHLPPPPPPLPLPSTNLNKQVLVPAVRKAHSESSLPTCDIPNSKPLVQDIGRDLKNTDVVANSETVVPSESGHSTGETKLDLSVGNHKGLLVSLPADIDVKSDGVKHFTECVQSPVQECRRSNVNKSVATSSHPLEQDGQDGDKSLEAMSGSQFGKNDKNDEIADAKLECEGSEGSIEDQKLLSESNEVVKVVGHTSRTSGAIPPPAPSHHKKVSLGRSSLAAPAMVFSRSSVSDKNRSGGSQTPSVVAKRLMSSSIAKSKKENVLADLEKNDNKHERSNSISKDNTNPGISSTKTVSTPTVRQYTSVGKESSRQSSVKMSPVESSSVTAGVSETTGTSQTEHAPLGQNKNISSGVLQRGEKVTQSNLPSSNPLTSSNSPAGLSDEELALLLHQELNSSPRVPRVPRVRNAGSVPQLSTANMLNKRTTTSGGKDQNTFSRRKSKDGSRTPHEQDSEVRKVDKVPTSSILSKKSDASAQAEGINEPLSAVKKKSEKTCTSAANCGSFSADADERKNLSARVASEDGTGAKKGPAQIYRTLPGLIAEIMGSGRRMTYEELCNAVLPHWPNLRKHNGERYAYSSHSQAVLDCLRNRTEWARLVDRGPKTSSSRKKRKIDTEPQNTESEDGEDRYNRDGDSKSFESNKEEFPRGRRQVRKRKRVAPQGRNVKDGQKRRKMEVGSDDSGSFSNSSEDSVSSEEDSGGSGMGAGRSEVSGSSHGALQ